MKIPIEISPAQVASALLAHKISSGKPTATEAVAALVTDLLENQPDHPNFDVQPTLHTTQVAQNGAIQSSDPTILHAAQIANIPAVPSPSPLTQSEFATATEGHIMSNFAGQLADVVIKAAEANKPAILAEIQKAEGGVEAAIVNAIKNAPKPGGPLAIVLPLVENEVAAYVQALVAKEGPEVVFNFLDAEAHAFAKSIGG